MISSSRKDKDEKEEESQLKGREYSPRILLKFDTLHNFDSDSNLSRSGIWKMVNVL